jgi:hypothetical protein
MLAPLAISIVNSYRTQSADGLGAVPYRGTARCASRFNFLTKQFGQSSYGRSGEPRGGHLGGSEKMVQKS